MTTYLPIRSGVRPPGLGMGTDLEAGSVIGWRRFSGRLRIRAVRSSDCDAPLTRSAADAALPKHARRAGKARSQEMLVTRMRELHHSAIAHHHSARRGAQRADARVTPLLRRLLREQPCNVVGRYGEAQLVVVTPGECELARVALTEERHQRLGERQFVPGELRSDGARAGELARIPEQPIGDVDAGARKAAQLLTECYAGCREQKALA